MLPTYRPICKGFSYADGISEYIKAVEAGQTPAESSFICTMFPKGTELVMEVQLEVVVTDLHGDDLGSILLAGQSPTSTGATC